MKKYMVSFFRAPIWNKFPSKTVSLFWVWLYITMKYLQLGPNTDYDICLQTKTESLRRLTNDETQREFKGKNFDYITPAGTFSYCDDKSLIDYSGML